MRTEGRWLGIELITVSVGKSKGSTFTSKVFGVEGFRSVSQQSGLR